MTMTIDDELAGGSRADRLQARLAASLGALRTRSRGRLDTERTLTLVGGGLLVAGAVLVLLGWYGAAHTSRLYLQIPYLISGGLLGVVAAFAGGSLYFASWMTRLVHEERARADAAEAVAADTNATLHRIEALLEAATPARPAAIASSLPGAALVATPSGRLAHRPDCPTVAGRRDLRPVDGDLGSLAPCRMCDPLAN